MNIVHMQSRDVTDKQQRHFVRPPQSNQYADSNEPAISSLSQREK